MTTIPTKEQIYDSIVADLEYEFDITLNAYGRNFLRVLAAIMAGVLKIYYLAVGSVQKNIAPDLADPQEQGGTLDRFGRLKLRRNRFPATQAQYTALVTGVTGNTIAAGTTFKSNDTSQSPGLLFILDNAFTLSGSTGSITIRALTAGDVSRLAVSDTLTATSPLVLVDNLITVTAETVVPRAAETIEEYRRKIIEAYRIETQGGAVGDYRLWGYDAQGLREIYPYASSGNNNEVDIYVEATIADSTDGNGTPGTPILDDVEDVIELSPDTTLTMAQRTRRPLGVFMVNVYPIEALPVAIEINDFADITAGKQADILAAITEALYDVRPFIAGLDPIADKNDIFDTNRIAAIILATVPGSSFGVITMTVDGGSPVATYTFDTGEIPYLDTITYIP